MPEFLYAPMEGITFSVYRRIHCRLFPGIKEYYTPFIAPDRTGSFKPKFLKELTKDSDCGLRVIPQLMVNNAEPFVITAGKLRDLGFSEVNLNAGCPSGTVFSKHKGAGMLENPEALDRILNEIFEKTEAEGLRVSIKTRMGVHSTQEFAEIAEVYRKYPVSLLIIHARDKDGQYRSEPDLAAFANYSGSFPFPVCYNGNIFSPEELSRAEQTVKTGIGSVMLGRGIVANPALARQLSGGEALACEELENFHSELLEEYLEDGLSPQFALERMKQLWYYMIHMFEDCGKEQKRILKSGSLNEYRAAAGTLFSSGKFNGAAKFHQI